MYNAVMMMRRPHHDTWRSSYCLDSSLSRHPLHTHTQLSLSLSLYSISSLFLFFKRRSGGDNRCGREERRRTRKGFYKGTLRPHLGLNYLFIYLFLQFMRSCSFFCEKSCSTYLIFFFGGLILSFVKIVERPYLIFFLGLIHSFGKKVSYKPIF